MASKLEGSRGRKARAAQNPDTTPYEQPQGTSRGVQDIRVPRMPHERDESATATGDRLDETPVPSGGHMERALDDVESGRKDTERRGIPSDVPSGRRAPTRGGRR